MKRVATAAGVIVVGLLLGCCGLGVRWLSYRDLARSPRSVEDVPVYGDLLRSGPPYERGGSPGSTRPPDYSGPGWGVLWSPDRRFAAVSTGWDDNYYLMPPPKRGTAIRSTLSLVSDATCFHTVAVWDEARHLLKPAVTVREADCLSGASHRYAWSGDSKALLVYGAESLDDGSVQRLCVVYLPLLAEAYRIEQCPASGL